MLLELCARGQEHLGRTEYLLAEQVLMRAEKMAWEGRDWETLSRLYMPLQEARRQKRQIALEGAMLNVWSDVFAPEALVEENEAGEILCVGWGTIAPGLAIRKLAAERKCYVEAFLAAGYKLGDRRAIVIVAREDASVPAVEEIGGIDQLLERVPAHSLVFSEEQLGPATAEGAVALWEKLHLPYLAAADAEADPVRRIAGYRRTIQVDNACELAHQKLSDTAAKLARKYM